MIELWMGEAVKLMHLNHIRYKDLAAQLGVSLGYVTMVLNGKRSPAGAEEKFMAALYYLIARRSV